MINDPYECPRCGQELYVIDEGWRFCVCGMRYYGLLNLQPKRKEMQTE